MSEYSTSCGLARWATIAPPFLFGGGRTKQASDLLSGEVKKREGGSKPIFTVCSGLSLRPAPPEEEGEGKNVEEEEATALFKNSPARGEGGKRADVRMSHEMGGEEEKC